VGDVGGDGLAMEGYYGGQCGDASTPTVRWERRGCCLSLLYKLLKFSLLKSWVVAEAIWRRMGGGSKGERSGGGGRAG
jgi:hypothetical protein